MDNVSAYGVGEGAGDCHSLKGKDVALRERICYAS